MLTERLSSVVDVGQVIAIDLLMPCSERGGRRRREGRATATVPAVTTNHP